MKKLRNLLNKLGEFFSDLNYFLSPFAFLYVMVSLFFAGLAGYHRDKEIRLQDQLTIQQSHIERWKMEAERNLTIIENLAIENKENQRKLEEIKSILGLND